MQKMVSWVLVLGVVGIVFYLIINELEIVAGDLFGAIGSFFTTIGKAFSSAFGWIGSFFTTSKPGF